jgi:hypothetical protein
MQAKKRERKVTGRKIQMTTPLQMFITNPFYAKVLGNDTTYDE